MCASRAMIGSMALFNDGAAMWETIENAKRDGTVYLLWFPRSTLPREISDSVDVGLSIDGWYFSSPKEIDDGWQTAFGSIGEPTHFAKLCGPT